MAGIFCNSHSIYLHQEKSSLQSHFLVTDGVRHSCTRVKLPMHSRWTENNVYTYFNVTVGNSVLLIETFLSLQSPQSCITFQYVLVSDSNKVVQHKDPQLRQDTLKTTKEHIRKKGGERWKGALAIVTTISAYKMWFVLFCYSWYPHPYWPLDHSAFIYCIMRIGTSPS